MKRIAVLLMSILMIVCSICVTGCGIQPNAENSYIISIYEEKYTQEESGKVVFNGYNLKKSFQVIKTQMYELDYEFDEKAGEKYVYNGIWGEEETIEDKKIQVLPTNDTTIKLREREKKTIRFFYKGKDVLSKLSLSNQEEYQKRFLDTYEESFFIKESYIREFTNIQSGSFVIELYTNAQFSGEPFAKTEMDDYYNEQIGFKLIKSTDVYVRVYID